jgi:hypothetical protein
MMQLIEKFGNVLFLRMCLLGEVLHHSFGPVLRMFSEFVVTTTRMNWKHFMSKPGVGTTIEFPDNHWNWQILSRYLLEMFPPNQALVFYEKKKNSSKMMSFSENSAFFKFQSYEKAQLNVSSDQGNYSAR